MKTVVRQWLTGAVLAFAGVLAPASAQQPPQKLTVALGSTSFAWLPFYVAQGAGYFKAEGLEIEVTNVAANATPVAAILSKSADIAGIGVQAAFAAADKKQPIKILTPMTTEFTSLIFARKGVMEKKGVTAHSPLKDRVKAMAGLKLATTAVGAGPDLMYRFLFARYGDGITVDKDARVVPVGDARNTLAAIKNGAVDVAAFSPPVPEKAISDGDAEMLIDTINGDIPETKGMVYTALAVTADKIRTDGPALEAFVRAIDRANKLIYADTAAAGKAARSFMSSMESNLYDASVKAMVPATPKAPTVSIDGLKVNMNVLKTGGYNYTVDYDTIVANDLVQRALAARK
ncbi:MAG TPA: ABC transporter substrate-binding protein [Ramlibacter sp.]